MSLLEVFLYTLVLFGGLMLVVFLVTPWVVYLVRRYNNWTEATIDRWKR